MPRSLMAVALVIALMSLPALAKDKDGNYVSIGSGLRDCSSWTNARKLNLPGAWQFNQWLAGFISGYNASVDGTLDISQGNEMKRLLAWVDTYCKSHPQKKVSQAADKLIEQLKRP